MPVFRSSDFLLEDYTDPTKKLSLNLSGLTTGTTTAGILELANVASTITSIKTHQETLKLYGDASTHNPLEVYDTAAVLKLYVNPAGSLVIKQPTYKMTLGAATLTADRAWTLPDVTDTATGLTATQTLTNKTLTTPTIGSFTNATHDHSNAAGGGTILFANLGTKPTTLAGYGITDAAPSAHNLLSTTHGDTLTGTVVRGDVIVGNATPKFARLAIGTSGKVLRSDGTDAAWTTLAASDIGSGTLALARGGTNADLSATGGAGRVLKQSSSGAAVTVATLAFSDVASKPTTISGYGITNAPTKTNFSFDVVATLAATTIATGVGLYLISLYEVVITTLVGANVVTLRWTDDFGAQSTTVTLPALAAGNKQTLTYFLEAVSGNVTIETNAYVSGELYIYATVMAFGTP